MTITSDVCVDGAKLLELPQKEWVLGSEIAARNHIFVALLNRKATLLYLFPTSLAFLRSAMGMVIANRKKLLRFWCAKIAVGVVPLLRSFGWNVFLIL